MYDPDYLTKSPLQSLLGVDTRREPALALQEALIQAIESIRPHGSDLLAGRDQQTFDLLLYRYVQRLTQEDIAHQLGVSERQLRRDQNRAIQVLVDRLWSEHGLAAHQPRSEEIQTTAPTSGAGNDSFAWLVEDGQDTLTDPNQVLVTVSELAEQVANHYGARLSWPTPANLPPLAIHPVAFRQILVILLAYAVQVGAGRETALSVSQAGLELSFEISVRPASREPGRDGALAQAQELAGLFKCSLTVSRETARLLFRLTVPVFERTTVLVIDDNADFAQLLRRYTAGTRYRVVGFQDAERALSQLETVRPRLIFLDVMMPQVDGWEMLRRLRKHHLAASCPIVVCTILNQASLAHALGASAFLRKPVTQADFLAMLERFSGPSATTPR